MKLDKITMVHHHVCYEEIHGYEFVILMPKGEHRKLHNRLRKENKCNIPVNELEKISINSKYAKECNKKYHKNISTLDFYETVMLYVQFQEQIQYNYKTENVSYSGYFRANGIDKKLFYIDIEE